MRNERATMGDSMPYGSFFKHERPSRPKRPDEHHFSTRRPASTYGEVPGAEDYVNRDHDDLEPDVDNRESSEDVSPWDDYESRNENDRGRDQDKGIWGEDMPSHEEEDMNSHEDADMDTHKEDEDISEQDPYFSKENAYGTQLMKKNKTRDNKPAPDDDDDFPGPWAYAGMDNTYYYPRREKGLGNDTSVQNHTAAAKEQSKPPTKPAGIKEASTKKAAQATTTKPPK